MSEIKKALVGEVLEHVDIDQQGDQIRLTTASGTVVAFNLKK